MIDAQLVAPGMGWVETDRAILRTIDDGHSWRDVTPSGLTFRVDPRNDVSNFRGLAAVDAETAFLATDKVGKTTTTVTIWATTDGGSTWEASALPPVRHLTGEICGNGCVTYGHAGVRLDAVDARLIFAELDMVTGMDTGSEDIFRSLDGGASWASLPWSIGPKYSSAWGANISFRSADVGAVLFEQRIFATDTGWGHWTELDQKRLAGTNEIPDWYGPVTFLDGRRWIVAGNLVAGNTFPVAESADAGRTWTVGIRTIPAKPGIDSGARVTFIDASTWVAVFSGSSRAAPGSGERATTWVSMDAGKHWTLIGDQPSPNPFGSDFVDRSHAWSVDSGGALATTTNGGATWSRICRESSGSPDSVGRRPLGGLVPGDTAIRGAGTNVRA